MPVSLATGKQRQEDHYEFEANLAYMVTCRTARAIRLAETSKGEKAQTGCSWNQQYQRQSWLCVLWLERRKTGPTRNTVTVGRACSGGVCLMVSRS